MEYKRNCENFCNTVLMLRKARNIGDEETVNHYVLSRLNSQKGDKFDFEILNEITACKNEEELRRCIRLLEKRHKYDKPELSWYFKWGFGHNHFLGERP